MNVEDMWDIIAANIMKDCEVTTNLFGWFTIPKCLLVNAYNKIENPQHSIES